MRLKASSVYRVEEDYYRTDAELVTASGSAKPVFPAPSVTSVISKQEIREMGARSLYEVLDMVSGLHVTPSSNFDCRAKVPGNTMKTVTAASIWPTPMDFSTTPGRIGSFCRTGP
ncbi:MAG: hypothetical protein JAZ19_15765 [Candidatus Thiodiazotropha taylori]|nr:hypothetical protein [Candidatus Thiodiazotropha taylori]